MDKSNILNSPVTKLNGVGPVRAALYAKKGIFTVEDVLDDYPRAYENRGNIELLDEITDPDIKHAVVLTVATVPKLVRLRRRNMSMLKFRAYDDSASVEITYFNQDFLKDKFQLGATYRFWGKVERFGRQYSMSSPVFEAMHGDTPLRDLMPVYRLTEGLTQKNVSDGVLAAMSLCGNDVPDFLPNEIRMRYKLCTKSFALKNIHNPEDFVSLAAARRRIVFDELFCFALGIAMTGKKTRTKGAYPCRDTDITPFLSKLGFELTGAQKRVVSQIQADMSSDTPMSRIVVGDVGSGKTVPAAIAMYIAAKNNRQAALMAPTEILARQHYSDLAPIFESLGISCELLIGALSPSKKEKIKEKLASGELDTVIGTQALITENVKFCRAGVIITDEQHRFGVLQRATLAEKGEKAHMLVMSATPIPRSLALALYGDLDMSVIDELPPGRQRVDTFVVDQSYRNRLDGFIRKNVEDGGQVYIVCPAVEETEKSGDEVELSELNDQGVIADTAPPLKAAVEYAKELRLRFPEYNIEFIHGKMKSAEKDKIMKSFSDGDVKILVSTTVIEVGVNVPNACLMIVENAERFGLSQLHQLRGRVGRGRRKSYCVLVYGGDSIECCGERAKRRLDIMKTCYDGFSIAEQDLVMRGPGDFLRGGNEDSIRQSGGIKFKIADITNDSAVLTAAFDSARQLIDKDPSLNSYPELKERVLSTFTIDISSVN